MGDVSKISGVGSSRAVTNLLAKVEQKLYGVEFDGEDFEFFTNVRFELGFTKINIEYGQKQKSTSQESSKEERKDSFTEASSQQDQRTVLDEGNQTDGGCRSFKTERAPVTTAIREFYRELQSDFDRQYVHRRRDGKLVVQIFEYFKHLDIDKSVLKVENYLKGPLHIDYNYYICDSKREDNDLILVVDAQTSFQLHEDKMLFYPLLKLDINFPNYKITNEGFYIKWDSYMTE